MNEKLKSMINKWWRFRNKNEVNIFLNLLRKYLRNEYDDAIINTCSKVHGAELLYVKIRKIDRSVATVDVLYRTRYNAFYMGDVDLYIKYPETEELPLATDTCCGYIKPVDKSLLNKETNKGENKMMKLIDKKMEQEIDKSRDKYRNLEKEFMYASPIGKNVQKIIDELKKYNKKIDLNLESFLLFDFLTEEDQKKRQDIVKAGIEVEFDIIAKYEECIELYKIADTFEQKENILKRYNILEFDKQV